VGSECRCIIEFLKNHTNTELSGLKYIKPRELGTVNFNNAFCWRNIPRQNLHESGFTCSVLPEKCNDFPGVYR
jgi:hypothetical protein